MSESGITAIAGATLKPADFGAREPTGADTEAFAAVAASLGFGSLQTGTRQHVQPAASIARSGGVPGNIVPLRALNNGVPGPLASTPEGLAAGLRQTTEANRARPDTASDSRALPRFAARATAPFEFTAGFPPAMQSVESVPMPTTIAAVMSREAVDAEAAAALLRHTAALSDPALSAGVAPVHTNLAQAAAVTAEAPVPLHHPRFAEAFSQQVAVMARDGVQQARITVNPPELGPVELRIVVRNDEASVQFAAQHAAVREVLEEALPRLREQFEQSGLRLQDGSVFDQLPQRSSGDERGLAYAPDGPQGADASADSPDPVMTVVRHGLIDAYA